MTYLNRLTYSFHDVSDSTNCVLYPTFSPTSLTEQDSHRAVAGLLLKNSLNQRTGPPSGETDAKALTYVKGTILSGLKDQDQMIRQTVGAVITSLLSNEDPGAWPEALDVITNGMRAQDFHVVEVSES